MNWIAIICALLLFVTWLILASLSIKSIRFLGLQIIVPWIFLVLHASKLIVCLLCVLLICINLVYLCVYYEVNNKHKKVIKKNGGKKNAR